MCIINTRHGPDTPYSATEQGRYPSYACTSFIALRIFDLDHLLKPDNHKRI